MEVPQLPVATDYKDAILISRQVLEMENSEIKARGNQKVANMEKILDYKTKLKIVKTVNKRMKLQIEDFKERAKDV